MIKLIKEKFLISLVVIVMLVLAVGSVNSLATSSVLIPTNSATKNNTANAADALTNNTTEDVGATESVGAGQNSSNTNSNRSRNNTTNTNTSNKTNTNSNTEKSGNKLPYAGTNGTVVFVVIALALSAIYAYKKVSDYNI